MRRREREEREVLEAEERRAEERRAQQALREARAAKGMLNWPHGPLEYPIKHRTQVLHLYHLA